MLKATDNGNLIANGENRTGLAYQLCMDLVFNGFLHQRNDGIAAGL